MYALAFLYLYRQIRFRGSVSGGVSWFIIFFCLS
nr:MAG TPA: hypothetical protein [Crassvirales sp.]DAU85495.1 MAG TPA: hypothetical protein [Crassvirales sp.]